jgi:hypothetical protein
MEVSLGVVVPLMIAPCTLCHEMMFRFPKLNQFLASLRSQSARLDLAVNIKSSLLASAKTTGKPTGSPICLSAKNKSRHWLRNVFVDNRGFPNQSDEYNTLLHDIDGGTILRKLKHPPPPLGVFVPEFHFPFNEALHGKRLRAQLDLFHLDPSIQLKVTALVKKYWSVFDERGVWVPVRNCVLIHQYVCFTDTSPKIPSGSATRVHIKYFLHCFGADEACLFGSSIVSTTGLCPPFDACPNTNMFQYLFGIKFTYKNHTHVWGVSPFEFA